MICNTLRGRVRSALCCLPLLAAGAAGAAITDVPGCGHLGNSFGPWDYRVDRGQPLQLVESAHFTPMVESLIRGATATRPGSDLDYTLRAFPNHHRALIAAARYADRLKATQPQDMRYSIDCWFQRAIVFQPEDLTVRMIYGDWLGKHKRSEEAMRQLQFVETKAGDDPFTQYNLGLVYFEVGAFDAALRQAHRAAAMGMPRQELKKSLIAAGKWQEPTAVAEPPAAAASATPAASQP